ncbi:MAG TPA: nucleotidyltransferase domain-containing protein [bacterium]|nr:nucleotidyltransferase domain-containing protein [bacterium]
MKESSVQDPALAAFEAAIRERLGERLKQMILYGSRARGDNDPDSDYDILLVVDEVTREVNRIIDDVAGDCFCEYSRLFPAIAVSEKEFQERLYCPLFMNVRREGLVL